MIPSKVKELRLMGNPFGCSCDVYLNLLSLSERVQQFLDFGHIVLYNCTPSQVSYRGHKAVARRHIMIQEAANELFCSKKFNAAEMVVHFMRSITFGLSALFSF